MSNQTAVTEFFLLGFSDIWELQILHFVVFLVLYLISLLGNLLIITAIALDRQLHTPMYFFLMNLSILDLGSVSVTIPKSMANSLMNTRSISYPGCVAQVFLFAFFASADYAILTVMAYDRYVAICQPLHYETVMNRRACVQMTACAWISVILYSAVHTGNTFAISFCGGNMVDQFFCEIPQLLKLTCSDSDLSEVGFLIFSLFLWLSCFVFIIVSYVQIFTAVVRMPSEQGRHKAFSTCLPHLIVVSLFLCTATFAYLKPISSSSSVQNLLVAVLYSVLPPMMNPIIYSMRNKELKGALSKLIGCRLFIKNEMSILLASPSCHFITNFSLLEGLLTSMLFLKILTNMVSEKTISFSSCHAQAYFLFLAVSMEFFLLAVMSFDNYVVIIYPLQYVTIESTHVSLLLPSQSVLRKKMSNQTAMTKFLLLGFSDVWELQILHFVVFLVLYLISLLGNLLIITAIALDRHLHSPMYFFLMNLSILDLGSISVTIPKSMANSLLNRRSISYSGRAAQVFLIFFIASADFAILTVMAYDRYIAICQPLHYERVMNRRACVQMAAGAWISVILYSAVHTGNTFAISFCGGNVVDQFFCEVPHLLKLACSDSDLSEVGVYLASSCFIFIIVSYVQIFTTVLRIPSEQGRHKAFSTCLPHLIVVSLFICTGTFAYLKPTSSSPSVLNLLVAVYSVLPPMMNPIIYSMRNKELKGALSKLIAWRLFSKNKMSLFLLQ
ncbi:LOW QUALITY PROTEIN: uncharacterized protein RBU57_014808 [Macrochelys suwanniensis]